VSWLISICGEQCALHGPGPEVFEVRDDDLLYVLDENPPEGLVAGEAAVRTCPKKHLH